MFMRTIYGIKADVSLDNMKYLRMLERMNEVGEAIVLPGNFPVEAFPGLRFLPAWFPGGGFKRWAAEAKKDLAYIVRELFKGARDVVSYNYLSTRAITQYLPLFSDVRLGLHANPIDGQSYFGNPEVAGG